MVLDSLQYDQTNYRCDENDICTGRAKAPSVPRATYGTAQKMRAAISHKYGRDHKLGTQPWSEHPTVAGKYIGNPSLSVTVSQYMVSLRRRKVSALALALPTSYSLSSRFGLVKLSRVLELWMRQP